MGKHSWKKRSVLIGIVSRSELILILARGCSPSAYFIDNMYILPVCSSSLYIFVCSDRYSESLELEDAVHTAILTLKESFEGQMTEDNIEIGICNQDGFRRLTPTEVKDYLAAIA